MGGADGGKLSFPRVGITSSWKRVPALKVSSQMRSWEHCRLRRACGRTPASGSRALRFLAVSETDRAQRLLNYTIRHVGRGAVNHFHFVHLIVSQIYLMTSLQPVGRAAVCPGHSDDKLTPSVAPCQSPSPPPTPKGTVSCVGLLLPPFPSPTPCHKATGGIL